MKQIKRLTLLAVVLGMMFTLTGCFRKTKEIDKETYGIDVARYQGTIDWPRVAQSGVEFAMVRLGYRSMSQGEIVADCNARYNLQEATKAGIPVGAYFFSTAITKEEAVEEAKWAAKILRDYPITYPVAYDCEGFNDPDSRHHGLSKEDRTDIALAFLKTIEVMGYEGMFYGSKNDLQGDVYWDTERIAKRYKIWVAQYPVEPYPATAQSSYEGGHQMWQHTMSGSVTGIDQPVDMNVAYFGYDGIEPAKSKEPPEEVGPDVEALMNFTQVQEIVTAKEETNLRNMPNQGEDSQIVYRLMNGETAQRVAVSADGWSKLIFNGQTVYAVTNLLTVVDEQGQQVHDDGIQTQFTPVQEQVTAKDLVNLRSLPSVEREDSEIVVQLKKGETAQRVGISDNGWSKLEWNGQTVYAVSNYLTTNLDGSDDETQPQDGQIQTDFSPVQEQVTAKDLVNLRTLPSVEREDSKIVVQLKKGETALRVGISDNGWSKLEWNGQTVYAVSNYLTTNLTGEEPETQAGSQQIQTQFEPIDDRVTAKDEVNLRSLPSVEDPDCVVVVKIKNGEVVQRTGINRDVGWSRVVYNGQTLYCVSQYLTAAE